ncbi:MAG: sigma-70 family RNA polymerase sigma factor [Victivallales bacterium]|nr:sigma-70 family RNA polymerase sigma factor [Victivallales bacterium]
MSKTIEISEVTENDLSLVERFNSGDQSAFEDIVKKYSSKAYQIAFGLLDCKADAEEVVQDAFLKVYKHLDKFRGDSSFTTWLYRIVVNLSRNKYHWHRRRGAEVNLSISGGSESNDKDSDIRHDFDIPDERYLPDRMLQSKESANRLVRAVRRLPDKLKEVLMMRHVDDLTYSEIAETIGCELGTVKSRLARAREALKFAMQKE